MESEFADHVLRIPEEVRTSMIDYLKSQLPNEGCGYLAGRGDVVDRFVAVRSETPSPRTFRMEGREQYRAERSIEDDGLAVLGIAHSHPSTAAFPSATDCAQLYWPVLDDGEYPLVHPQALRVIVSLRDPDAPEVRAFRLVEEVPVR